MHIGLVGGIGVAATVVYYQRLTAAVAPLLKTSRSAAMAMCQT